MLSNPGFSFSNMVGTCVRKPLSEAGLPWWGKIYSEAIVVVGSPRLKRIYADSTSVIPDNSVALEFAALQIDDVDRILQFCSTYGMPCSEHTAANFRNEYLFAGGSKDDAIDRIHLRHKERDWLGNVQKQIADMHLLLDLNEAISCKDYTTIFKVITFFAFDWNRLDFENTRRTTEIMQFNHSFLRFAETQGFDKRLGLNGLQLHDLVVGFMKDMKQNLLFAPGSIEELLGQPDLYPQLKYSSTWQWLYSIYSALIQKVQLEKVSPFGAVEFSKDLHHLSLVVQKAVGREVLLALGQSVLTDLFREHLTSVTPEIQFEKGAAISSWRIPNLLSAMYLELFFRLSPTGSVKKCQNPDCRNYFQWSVRTPNKKYCSNGCAVLMAKRMQRAREKKQTRDRSEP